MQTPLRENFADPTEGGTDVVFGMQVWLKSYGIILRNAHNKLADVDCRVTTLKFATDVRTFVKFSNDYGIHEEVPEIEVLAEAPDAYPSDKRSYLYY
jgi:hypothetical protein